jgi:hypothetical protein
MRTTAVHPRELASPLSNPRADGEGPPLPPVDLPSPPVDEGPMRRDLLRQIAWLEADHQELVAAICPWTSAPANLNRAGPRVLSAAELEAVRDELFAAIDRLRAGLHD